MKKVTRKNYRVSSKLIHGPELMTKQWDFSHHVVPPQSSSVTYAVSSAQRGALGFIQFASETELNQEPILIYDRLEEPNRNMLEERLALAEGGDMAVAFTTGRHIGGPRSTYQIGRAHNRAPYALRLHIQPSCKLVSARRKKRHLHQSFRYRKSYARNKKRDARNIP